MNKSLECVLNTNYNDYYKTISELSKPNKNAEGLVLDERYMYDFDKVTEEIYGKGNKKPASADSIYVNKGKIILAEYKSGFMKKISKENYDPEQMACPYEEEFWECEPYRDMLFKLHKKDNELLVDSLKLKAVESYVTLEKELLKSDNIEDYYIELCVVIDAPIDHQEDMLNELAGKKSDNNIFTAVRNSMKRFMKSKDRNYYYDEVYVYSPDSFRKYLDKRM